MKQLIFTLLVLTFSFHVQAELSAVPPDQLSKIFEELWEDQQNALEDDPFIEFEKFEEIDKTKLRSEEERKQSLQELIGKLQLEDERKQSLQKIISEIFIKDFQPPQDLTIETTKSPNFIFAFFTQNKKDQDLVCKGFLLNTKVTEENNPHVKKYININMNCLDRLTGHRAISDLTRQINSK